MIAAVTTIIISLFFYFELRGSMYAAILILSVFIVSFFIIQYRVEKFIYKRVKKIYDDVSLLESTNFQAQPITTDMRTLTEEIEKFFYNEFDYRENFHT